MSQDTEQVDHKAEALKALSRRTPGKIGKPESASDPDYGAALIHSNLAIAEGQERVAEELTELRRLFASTNGSFAEIQVDGHVTTGAP
jgi:hypothetical protein